MVFACGLRRVAMFGSVAVAGLLAACGSSFFEEPVIPACPRAFLPSDTASLTEFNGAGRDLTDVIVQADFDGYNGNCAYDLDDKVVEILISPVILAELGPAATNRNASLQYFVALKDPDGNFIEKSVFDVALVFPNNLNLVRYRDKEVTLKLPLDDVWAGPDYEIYLGFQMSRDQLDYNRRLGGN
ncbi:MAG: hypothetical protein ABID63_02830 [Pseudomonadota bacterium]